MTPINPKRERPITTPKTKISEIQRIMHKYKVHTVLVVDKDNHLKGIVDHYACMV